MKVELGGMKTITELTRAQKDVIKEELTLDNPAYEQVKRYSQYGNTSMPPYLFYYKSAGNALLVPRGYKIPFKHDIVLDDRVSKRVTYPRFKLTLRDTQKQAYNAWTKNTDNGVVVLPTGKGKSILGIYMASATREKTLVIVQKDDLIDGWKKDIKECLGLRPKQVGLIKGKISRIGQQITLTTIQTLSRLSSKEEMKLHEEFGLIICDEFHHSPATSYGLLQHFKAKYFVGLTATDMRNDGLQAVMYWLFGDVCFRHIETEDDEDIMPYSVMIRNSNVVYHPPAFYRYKGQIISDKEAYELKEDGEGKKVKRLPLNSADLRRAINGNAEFNDMVARDIICEYKNRKSCIAFMHEKDHIRYIRDLLLRKGVPAKHIVLYYGDATESDSEMKRKMETKESYIMLATFAKATEGTNIKSLERGFLVTSLNNETNTIQAVGRVRRRKEGKEDVIIYDFRHPNVTSVCNHGKTRDKAYKVTKGKIINPSKGLIQKGWRRY